MRLLTREELRAEATSRGYDPPTAGHLAVLQSRGLFLTPVAHDTERHGQPALWGEDALIWLCDLSWLRQGSTREADLRLGLWMQGHESVSTGHDAEEVRGLLVERLEGLQRLVSGNTWERVSDLTEDAQDATCTHTAQSIRACTRLHRVVEGWSTHRFFNDAAEAGKFDEATGKFDEATGEGIRNVTHPVLKKQRVRVEVVEGVSHEMAVETARYPDPSIPAGPLHALHADLAEHALYQRVGLCGDGWSIPSLIVAIQEASPAALATARDALRLRLSSALWEWPRHAHGVERLPGVPHGEWWRAFEAPAALLLTALMLAVELAAPHEQERRDLLYLALGALLNGRRELTYKRDAAVIALLMYEPQERLISDLDLLKAVMGLPVT